MISHFYSIKKGLIMASPPCVRFGKWEDILAEAKPPAGLHLWTGIWHDARGMAYTHTGKSDAAEEELQAVDICTSKFRLRFRQFPSNPNYYNP